jgi:hypothetical protein
MRFGQQKAPPRVARLEQEIEATERRIEQERDELRKTNTLIEQSEAAKNEITALEVSGELDSTSAAKRFEQTQEKIRRHRDERERFERLIARREQNLAACRLELERARFDVIYEELTAGCASPVAPVKALQIEG